MYQRKPKQIEIPSNPHTVTVEHLPDRSGLEEAITRLGKPLNVHAYNAGDGSLVTVTLVQVKHPQECSRLSWRHCWYDRRGRDGYEYFLDLADGTYAVKPNGRPGRDNLDITPIQPDTQG